MKILLVRHPLTSANINQTVNFGLNDPISLEGYVQMEKVVERLKDQHLDFLYSSDAKRCVELAEKIAEGRDLDPIQYPVFREIDNGDMGGSHRDEMNDFRRSNTASTRPPNGESLDDLFNRGKKGLNLLVQGGGNSVILVSHGLYLRMFVGGILGLDPKTSMGTFKFSNCGLSELEVNGENIRINYLNDKYHLR